MSDSLDLRTIWPELVEQRLDDDREQHPFALPGCPPFVMHSDERQVSVDAELDAIDHLLSTAAEARARRDHSAVDRALRELTERYSMPE